jgi:uncharacterized Zn-finger protein
MREHMCIHTEQRQFVCQICNKSYSRADRLKRHQVIHGNKNL